MKKNNTRKNRLVMLGLLVCIFMAGCFHPQVTPIEEAKPVVRVGGLKGPTTMGLVKLLDEAKNGALGFETEFTMMPAADGLTPAFLQGDLDLIAVPANLASVLYNKTEGQVCVLAVNTLGVLSIVETGDEIHSLTDLKGKTIYATGQGTTPEYVLRYLLSQNGLDPDTDVQMEFKSEAAEVLSVMSAAEGDCIAMLPQPFVTVAGAQLGGLRIAIDFNAEWEKLQNGCSLVTGVLVAKKEYVEKNGALIREFLDAYKSSADISDENIDEIAALIEANDIVKAPIAKKALPSCNITFMEGSEMKDALQGYLEILKEQDPKSIGGALPGEDFYALTQ